MTHTTHTTRYWIGYRPAEALDADALLPIITLSDHRDAIEAAGNMAEGAAVSLPWFVGGRGGRRLHGPRAPLHLPRRRDRRRGRRAGVTAATEARGLALFTLDANGTPLEPHYCVTFRKGSDVPNRLLSYAELDDAVKFARGIGIGAVCNGGRVLEQHDTPGGVELDMVNPEGVPCYAEAKACRCAPGYEAAR